MTQLRAVFLMSEESGRLTDSIACKVGVDLISKTVGSLEELEAAFTEPQDLLLSFGTGVIVPAHILRTPGILALNIHAASPGYPGRDPHHFAVYDGAKKYGATIHYMTEKVDQGPIVDVELFDVPERASATDLLKGAGDLGLELMRRFFATYLVSGAPAPRGDITWGSCVSKRSDFIELCRVDCGMSESEFLRRLESTAMPGYKNLYVDVHGYRFRLEGKVE